MSVHGLYATLFYIAGIILVVGVVRKIMTYARTPAPLKIPTTPAPITTGGVVWRMAKEVTVFESLFKSNKWIWVFGWIFHFSLLLAFIRHLRYAMEPEGILWMLVNFEVVQAAGKYAGLAMMVGLLGLLARRVVVDRVRYISSPSDFLMLLLLLSIAGTGVGMSFVSHTDIVQLKAFALSLIDLNLLSVEPLPNDTLVLTHLALVILLMTIFPISKLLHAPGVFFSPTRNQKDDARERRHTDGWTADDSATSKPV